jgi:hypothetical protein
MFLTPCIRSAVHVLWSSLRICGIWVYSESIRLCYEGGWKTQANCSSHRS